MSDRADEPFTDADNARIRAKLENPQCAYLNYYDAWKLLREVERLRAIETKALKKEIKP